MIGRTLCGLQVLVLSSSTASLQAAMMFAEYGATVQRIDPQMGHPFAGEPAFAMWTRATFTGDASLLELENAAGLRRLVGEHDVLIVDLEALDEIGHIVELSDLEQSFPHLVTVLISTFPSELGEHLPGADAVVSAALGCLNGLDDIQGGYLGDSDAMALDHPIYKVAWTSSFATGQLAFQGALAALRYRHLHGHGQRVSTSLVDGATSLLMRRELTITPSAKGPATPDPAQQIKHRGIRLAFMTVQCAEGRWVQMCARQNHHFAAWLRSMDIDGDLSTDPRFTKGPLGIPSLSDANELEREIRKRMAQKTSLEWFDIFGSAVGADPFLTPNEFMVDPQILHNQRVLEVRDDDRRLSLQPGPLVLDDEELRHGRQSVAAGKRKPEKNWPRPAEGWSKRPTALPTDWAVDGPLAGVTIIELAYYLAAPLAGVLLAELGARVIKIEPATGDPFRAIGSQAIPMLHGKQSVVLDLTTEVGQHTLHELVAAADVFYTNLRGSAQRKLRFDYESLKSCNPGLTYVYASGYGSKGAWSERPAFHSTPNAWCGAGVTQAGEGNNPVDDSWPDPVSGLVAASAILLGLARTAATGSGGYLETSMLCSSAYAYSRDFMAALRDAPLPPMDSAQAGRGPLERVYECSDGWLVLEVLTDAQFDRLASALHSPQLSALATGITRQTARTDARLQAELVELFGSLKVDDAVSALRAAGVPCAAADGSDPVAALSKAGLMSQSNYPPIGQYWRHREHVRLSKSQSVLGAPCQIGQHTGAVLSALESKAGSL